MDLQDAYAACKPFRGKRLADWFESVMALPDSQLQKSSEVFLKTMATWVFQKMSNRRKGGVPMGFLEKFVYPESHKISFLETLMKQVVYILRKRGLVEYEESKKSDLLVALEKAYHQAPKVTK